MVRRTLMIFCLLVFCALAQGLPVFGQDDAARADVIEITGHLDWAALEYVSDRIDVAAQSGSQLAIIQIDSRATLSQDIHHLLTRVVDPPLPLVVWVGPAPASAYGGATHMLAAAPLRAAAPGVRIGFSDPIVAGSSTPESSAQPGLPSPPTLYRDQEVEVTQPIPGLVDVVAPSINNLLVELDGRTVEVRGTLTTLRTLQSSADGMVAIPTVFSEPGLAVRILRTATGAESAFFFLVVGLTIGAFEFYALGPGIAAGLAALCVLISGYGLGSLPLRWWGVGLTLLAWLTMTADFQRGRAGSLTGLGAMAMFLGGVFFTDAAPQIVPSWWIVAVIVIAVTAFYVVGMRTVARARFSTPTIGREYLVGRWGRAVTAFAPDGVVEVDGARWKATAHREAGLTRGSPVIVEAVEGVFLAVAPLEEPESLLEPPQASTQATSQERVAPREGPETLPEQ